MTQATIDKLAKAIRIFGWVFMVVATGVLIWSLFQPPVTSGPMPSDPSHTQPPR